jgi:hypothetical protein
MANETLLSKGAHGPFFSDGATGIWNAASPAHQRSAGSS